MNKDSLLIEELESLAVWLTGGLSDYAQEAIKADVDTLRQAATRLRELGEEVARLTELEIDRVGMLAAANKFLQLFGEKEDKLKTENETLKGGLADAWESMRTSDCRCCNRASGIIALALNPTKKQEGCGERKNIHINCQHCGCGITTAESSTDIKCPRCGGTVGVRSC